MADTAAYLVTEGLGDFARDPDAPMLVTGGLLEISGGTGASGAIALQSTGRLLMQSAGAVLLQSSTASNPLEPDVHVGSWAQSELGRWFTAALADYRGTPTWVPWKASEVYRAFLLAVTTYDVTGAPPYPPLQPELAQWFLNYLRKNGG